MAGGPHSASLGPGVVRVSSQKKKQRNVVAWQSKAEWDQVMVGLFCGDCETQQEALDRITAWKSRFGHRMPLAVECTADLIRCKILDTSGGLKSHELVLMYGLALVRFVNLITEGRQKTVIIPLRRLAEEMNIPVWIVNLRHELTHRSLPQLSACQKGCDAALEWLRRTYWSRQLSGSLIIGGEEEDDEDDEESAADTGTESSAEELEKSQSPSCQKLQRKVTDVLVSYKNQQLAVLQQLSNVARACKIWCSPSSEVEWIVAQVKDLLQENRVVVASALLDNGFLIPATEELKVLKISTQEIKEWDFKIPRMLLRFWQPLLKGLHSRDFTQTLLEKMFEELKKDTQNSEHRSQYLIKWITTILKANMQAKKKLKRRPTSKKKASLEPFLHHVSLQWLKLLDGCLEAPCWASPHLLHLILLSMEPPLPSASQKKLLYLTSIYTQEDAPLGSPGVPSDLRRQPIYTVESLQWKVKQSSASWGLPKKAAKRKMPVEEEEVTEEEEEEEEAMKMEAQLSPEPAVPENMMALAEKRVALQGSVWQVGSDEVKWKNFPLGRLPGQSDDPDGLLVDNCCMMSAFDQLENGDRKSSPSTIASEWGNSVAEGLLWTQSELHKLKSGLQLF